MFEQFTIKYWRSGVSSHCSNFFPISFFIKHFPFYIPTFLMSRHETPLTNFFSLIHFIKLTRLR
eukprot:UN01567